MVVENVRVGLFGHELGTVIGEREPHSESGVLDGGDGLLNSVLGTLSGDME